MKKLVALLVCFSIVFLFAGCSGGKYDTDFTISRMTYFADNKEKTLTYFDNNIKNARK